MTELLEKAFAKVAELPALEQNIFANWILFEKNPYHPSLYFKRVHSTQPIYSVDKALATSHKYSSA